MKIPHPKVIKLIVPFFVYFILCSCTKDTDLLADYVVADSESQSLGDIVFDDSFTISGVQPLVLDVLSNDMFTNSKNVKIIDVSQPANGTVIINTDNTITYFPAGSDTAGETKTAQTENTDTQSNDTPSNDGASTETTSADTSETASAESSQTDTSTSETTSSTNNTESESEDTPSEETTSSATPEDHSPDSASEETASTDTTETDTTDTPSSEPEEPASTDTSSEPADDTFTYTTESTNEDDTVSTEEGTVTVKTNNGSTIYLNTLKAFPSAQGHGADVVTGGKGGKIFYVTSLANNTKGSYDSATDTYSGSFKYCITRTEPGYLIFRVSGKITASSNSDYYFTSSNMGNKTIMGGTAPYPGVVFTGARFRTSGVGDNWIWRGITWTVGNTGTPGSEDAFSMVEGTERIIFSDNSAGWAYDESFSIGNTNNTTVQRNFAFENEPSHNTGSIFSTDLSVSKARKISAHNNVYSLISKRFPNLRGRKTDQFDAVNNSAYGYSTQFGSHKGGLRLNDINNYYVPDSGSGSTPNKRWNADTEAAPVHEDPSIYTEGNIIKGKFDGTKKDDRTLWEHHVNSGGFKKGQPLPSNWFKDTPFPLGMDINLKTALEAYNYNVVGKNVGARFYMDAKGERQKYIHPFVDEYFEDFINGTTRALKNDEKRFVIPSLPNSGKPYADTDNDGMADAWEKSHGLIVGEDDKEGVKKDWYIDGVNFTNNAGFSNIQMFDDYVHGGFMILRDQQ